MSLDKEEIKLCLTIPKEIEELDEENRDFVITTLQNYINISVLKYVKGQLEHGGKLWERNCLSEAALENIDLMWYLAGEDKRQELK